MPTVGKEPEFQSSTDGEFQKVGMEEGKEEEVLVRFTVEPWAPEWGRCGLA